MTVDESVERSAGTDELGDVRLGRMVVWVWPLASIILTMASAALLALVLTTFPPDSAVYPTFVLAGLTLLLLILSVQAVRVGLSASPTPKEDQQYGGGIRDYWTTLAAITIFLGVWVWYAFALGAIGFVIPTWAAMAISLCVLASTWKTRVWALTATAPFAVGLYLILQVGLTVGLPMGALDVMIVDYYYGLVS